MDENQTHEQEKLKLDGSFGTGPLAELTIITKTETGGEKEETFTFPYAIIDFGALVAYDRFHLIKGYRVVKQDKPDSLKELGL